MINRPHGIENAPIFVMPDHGHTEPRRTGPLDRRLRDEGYLGGEGTGLDAPLYRIGLNRDRLERLRQPGYLE